MAVRKDLTMHVGETGVETVESADYSAVTVQLVFETLDGKAIASVPDGAVTKNTTNFQFAKPAALTSCARQVRWALWDTLGNEVLMEGEIGVLYVPQRTP
ncbi:MAG: hypothetical protein NXI32_22900 [bacterium]|nr:hypothetical protein [bacterium]